MIMISDQIKVDCIIFILTMLLFIFFSFIFYNRQTLICVYACALVIELQWILVMIFKQWILQVDQYTNSPAARESPHSAAICLLYFKMYIKSSQSLYGRGY